VFAMLDGDVHEARRRCEPLVGHDHLWVRYAAAVAIGNVGVIADEPERTLELCGRVHAEANAADVDLVGGADIHLAIQLNAMVHAGQLEFALALAAGAHEQAAQQPSLQVRAWAATLLGRVASFTGDLTTASRAVAEGELLWLRSGHQGIAAWCAAGLAQAQVQLGAADEAAETARADRRLPPQGLRAVRGDGDAGAGLARHTRQVIGPALRRTSAPRSSSTRFGQTTVLGWVWHDAARLDLLGLLGDVRCGTRPSQGFSAMRWDVRAGAPDQRRSRARHGRCRGVRVDRCVAVRGRGVRVGIDGRRGAPATPARRPGSTDVPARSWRGAAVSPHRCCRVDRRSGPLSAREHEIASLAASGLTNRQIAQRAVVSERTVENHLYRVFIKLGISSRDELAAAISG
jgi:DNA-binding CsgD family transcriptional regulator